jgi:hypothetical protein
MWTLREKTIRTNRLGVVRSSNRAFCQPDLDDGMICLWLSPEVVLVDSLLLILIISFLFSIFMVFEHLFIKALLGFVVPVCACFARS